MPRTPSPIARLLIASTLALASSCAARRQHPAVPYPPAADLKIEAEPVAAPAIATSEQAYEDYNEAVAAWGKRGWAAVARLCPLFEGDGDGGGVPRGGTYRRSARWIVTLRN